MMPGGGTTTAIICLGCGKRYAWKPQLAGRKVKCACGQVMIAPPAPAPEMQPQMKPQTQTEEDELYGLAPDPVAPAPTRAIPITTSSGPRIAPDSQMLAVEYRRPDVSGSGGAMEVYFPDRVKDLYLPLALIAGGTFIEFALSLFSGRAGFEGAARSVMFVGIYMIVNTILMLLAIFFVAKVRDISFGPLPTAILKLCAISIGPGAIGSLVGLLLMWIPLLGGLIGWIVGFILYFALIGALFDLDESDTWWCVITVFVVKLLVVFAVIGYLFRMM